MKIWHRLKLSMAAAALSAPLLAGAAATAVTTDELADSFTPTMKAKTSRIGNTAGSSGGVLGSRFAGAQLGIDTLPNFAGYFYYPGVAISGGYAYPQYTWQYTMVGRSPVGTGGIGDTDDTGVTRVRAPVVPVIIDLRNFDGSPRYFIFADGTVGPRMILDPTANIKATLKSPIFSAASYTSSKRATQFTDAVQRAEFYNTAGPGWHTLLTPVIAPTRTVQLIRGSYRFNVDATGHLRYVLVDSGTFSNALFPATASDTTTVLGAAENAGDVKTTDLITLLFQDTYLYNNGNPADCCILGYHSYDSEPGDASNGFRERHYVMNYSSYLSPGIFTGWADVTVLSHELAETFNDPFVNNATPIWLAPNGNCQNNLETGDVIEGLSNAIQPMTLNGTTYHPQNEALLQWFAGVPSSSAIGGAYSYPNAAVLPTPAQSLQLDCATPFTLP